MGGRGQAGEADRVFLSGTRQQAMKTARELAEARVFEDAPRVLDVIRPDGLIDTRYQRAGRFGGAMRVKVHGKQPGTDEPKTAADYGTLWREAYVDEDRIVQRRDLLIAERSEAAARGEAISPEFDEQLRHAFELAEGLERFTVVPPRPYAVVRVTPQRLYVEPIDVGTGAVLRKGYGSTNYVDRATFERDGTVRIYSVATFHADREDAWRVPAERKGERIAELQGKLDAAVAEAELFGKAWIQDKGAPS